MKLVIDTNIWLDLLVFHDPSVASLREALTKGVAQCLGSEPMFSELADVISRPQFALSALDQSRALNQARHWCQIFPGEDVPPSLLICRDKDDQKFLDLAFAACAPLLLTKDKDLLRLASRAKKHSLTIAKQWPVPLGTQ